MQVNAPTNNDHPIRQVFERITIRAPMRDFNVLEVFAGPGNSHLIHYAAHPLVGGLVCWEIDPNVAGNVKALIPGADVVPCDSFEEVAKLKPHFDVIVVDNNLIQAPRFEHFDLFPDICKGLKPHSFLVVSVCTDPAAYYVPREAFCRELLGENIDMFVRDWDKARAAFYNLPEIDPDDYLKTPGRIIPLQAMSANDMIPVYMEKILKTGFFTKYQVAIRRSAAMSYLLFELERASTKQEREKKIRAKTEKHASEKKRRATRKPKK